ncbi:beta-ketoacyl synthase chain length factor [uncultured Photobacterium sp.]|uniref:beta-ketoacyl synthase chain length factor n=1 Tax=uncultured Photobacterium sp. TaxID=173973 RepID=UPI00260E1D7E|nr:beta-ketoacyl synthase chain length factor [uncultured Photobacterium sp.]
MNSVRFNIECWQALSPGLGDIDAWKAWVASEKQWPETLSPVPVTDIPPMLRRRMSSLSKMAIQTAISLAKDSDIDFIVFSSRHGELERTAKLLRDILQGEDASPIAFSQSVHNTAAGLFTIATKQAIPVTSLAAGEHSLHSAIIEASAYLAENPQHRILVVDFDEPLPAPYHSFEVKQHQAFALGLILSNGSQYQLSWQAGDQSFPSSATLPQTLDVIANLVSGSHAWTIDGKRTQWHWKC